MFAWCQSVNESLIIYKCLSSNSNYSKSIDAELKNRLKDTFKFSNDINKLFCCQQDMMKEKDMMIGKN